MALAIASRSAKSIMRPFSQRRDRRDGQAAERVAARRANSSAPSSLGCLGGSRRPVRIALRSATLLDFGRAAIVARAAKGDVAAAAAIQTIVTSSAEKQVISALAVELVFPIEPADDVASLSPHEDIGVARARYLMSWVVEEARAQLAEPRYYGRRITDCHRAGALR